MSAFPKSGRSDASKSTKTNVCFRPEADIQEVENDQAKGGYIGAQPQDNIHCKERYRRDVHTSLETG